MFRPNTGSIIAIISDWKEKTSRHRIVSSSSTLSMLDLLSAMRAAFHCNRLFLFKLFRKTRGKDTRRQRKHADT
jgi:hypothetical protein